ncbi:MAG TPA: NUDIX hydrolase [Bacillales bacterium]|nr:NUDIX hydrolase [Bacillales bacterium]
MERVDVASALIFDEAQANVLMVRNKKGESTYWSLPGGAVEIGETLEEAAKRETKEECGFDIEVTGLYSVREVFFTERDHHALLFTFHTRVIKDEIKILDPDEEIVEVKWMDLQTANRLMPYLTEELKVRSGGNYFSPYLFQGTE